MPSRTHTKTPPSQVVPSSEAMIATGSMKSSAGIRYSVTEPRPYSADAESWAIEPVAAMAMKPMVTQPIFDAPTPSTSSPPSAASSASNSCSPSSPASVLIVDPQSLDVVLDVAELVGAVHRDDG